MTEPTSPRDYSQTLFLPKTEFPMRAGLPQKEPEILARWGQINLYQKLREKSAGKARFVLHDGPPYANGHLHIGHALNKILKDIVVRSQQMAGYDANYVPGWDCHGLPIEWKIEEQYRAKGKNKDEVNINEFRGECRAFAQHWLDIQREEFKRLGGTGDWDNPYCTMAYHAEAQIAKEIMTFADNGLLYRGSKPVMWSVVEKTALAEAEVEYHEHTSTTVFVKFKLASIGFGSGGDWSNPEDRARVFKQQRELLDANASIVIWTTTPWTLPANRAIAFSPKIEYAAYRVTDAPDNNSTIKGEIFILAKKLAQTVATVAKVALEEVQTDLIFDNNMFFTTTCIHPFAPFNKDHYGSFSVPLIPADFVTDDTGTGFVHIAPGHGQDDYMLWSNNKDTFAHHRTKEVPHTVQADGTYYSHVALFEGARVYDDKGKEGDANKRVIEKLIEANAIVARGKLRHSYPHSWRSKAPLIFRNTPQWFISMDAPFKIEGSGSKAWMARTSLAMTGEDQAHEPQPVMPRLGLGIHDLATDEVQSPQQNMSLRNIALHTIKQTQWVPAAGENRITGMIAGRPDWVVSRQRAWGVPIAVFVHKETGKILKDEAVNARIIDAFNAEGADAWFATGAFSSKVVTRLREENATKKENPAERFLKPEHNPNDFEQVIDVLDVWFDSGSTHAYTLEDPVHFPAFKGLKRKCDGGNDIVMYLEGSDQHRGWFHSSLLESCGTRGRAPFDVVLTHGFVLDEKGNKMSKSVGNVVAPQDVIKQSGADILRLWVAASDYSDDLRIGAEIIKTFNETYRKLRNTLRWMLGALHHKTHDVGHNQMHGLERYMLHKLAVLDGEIKAAYTAYDYKRVVSLLSHFMTADLSAFYFDVRKDTLYCEAPSSPVRAATLSTIDHIFRCVTLWLAPILAFTCEEAWLERYPEVKAAGGSVHLEAFPEIPAEWRNEGLAATWETIRKVRRVVTGALEVERAAKNIGSSLEAAPHVFIPDAKIRELLNTEFEGNTEDGFADVCITSALTFAEGNAPSTAFRLPDVDGVAVVFEKAAGQKCARSWRIRNDIGADPTYPDVSLRDALALKEWDAMAEQGV
jgi:isoleucyl-tRNA synthetase